MKFFESTLKYEHMRLNKFFKLVIAVAISEMAGVVGAIFTMPSIQSWYVTLIKPVFNPPAWVFGPVWIALFALMGISVFLVWSSSANASARREKGGLKIAFGIFGVQLALNVLWSIIFFGFHDPEGAFVDIIFLWFAILATIIIFYKTSKPAAWLLAPYILWVSFAAYLNFAVWMLN